MIRSENTIMHASFKSFSERIIHRLKFLSKLHDYARLFECTPSIIVSSPDASNTGCSAILFLDNIICHKNCSSGERSESSKWIDMTAVHFGSNSFEKFISCKSDQFVDSLIVNRP